MSRKELIRAIEEHANNAAAEDPETHVVLSAKAAIAIVEELDFDFDD